uniref:NADH dehydrogenase subunit 6 n=1 Tax=Brachyplatys subaeneus TaxID=355284 RepID=UPI001D1068B0|nr:NADH dehydrogenase subunit 6 [Brachyplatys subaeneus]UCC45919.1 NADH dehydrogenase subunit 6 [Brachyplatys subaeneus]
MSQVTMSLLMTLAIMMTYMKHPLSMGMTLIVQTLVVSMICGMMFKSFLFSYIIVMIMLSGMLVLFIYMSSVASNEKFKSSIKTSIIGFMLISTMSYIDMFYKMEWKITEVSKTLIKMFNTSSIILTIMVMMYLLFTMITVSTIANIEEGPLRMKK